MYEGTHNSIGAFATADDISFTKLFCKPQSLCTLDELTADILAIKNEARGLLDGPPKGVAR